MVNADALTGTRSTGVPSREIHRPTRRNGILHLDEKEVGALKVAALNVVGIREADDPGPAAVEQAIAFAALRTLVVVVDLEQGEVIVVRITRAVQGREHILAAIEGRRVDHGARAQIGPAIFDDGEAYGGIALALPPLDLRAGHIHLARLAAAPCPVDISEQGCSPLDVQAHRTGQFRRHLQAQNGPLPGHIAGCDPAVIIVVAKVIRPLLPRALHIGHPQLRTGWQMKIIEVERDTLGAVHMHGRDVLGDATLGRQIHGVFLDHPVQVLAPFSGFLVRPQPGGLHIEGRQLDRASGQAEQRRRTRTGIGLGRQGKGNEQKTDGRQTEVEDGSHGYAGFPESGRTCKVRPDPAHFFGNWGANPGMGAGRLPLSFEHDPVPTTLPRAHRPGPCRPDGMPLCRAGTGIGSGARREVQHPALLHEPHVRGQRGSGRTRGNGDSRHARGARSAFRLHPGRRPPAGR